MKLITLSLVLLIAACNSDSRIEVDSGMQNNQPSSNARPPLMQACVANDEITVSPYLINIHNQAIYNDYVDWLKGENQPADPANDNDRLGAVTQAIYRHIPDAFDFLQIHPSQGVEGGVGAFYAEVRQDANPGLGRPGVFDESAPFGSDEKLKGIINVMDPDLFRVTTHELFHYNDYSQFQTEPVFGFSTGGFGYSTLDHSYGRLSDNTTGELFAGPHRAFGPLAGLADFGIGTPLNSLACANDLTRQFPCDPDADGWQRFLVPAQEQGTRPAAAPMLELYMMGLASFDEIPDDIKLLTNYRIEDDGNGNAILALEDLVDVPLDAFRNNLPAATPLPEADRKYRMGFVVVSPEKLSIDTVPEISNWAEHYESPSISNAFKLRNWYELTDGRSEMLTRLCN